MLPVYVVAFELLIVILFGVFFRLETSTLTNASSFVGILVFLSGTQQFEFRICSFRNGEKKLILDIVREFADIGWDVYAMESVMDGVLE